MRMATRTSLARCSCLLLVCRICCRWLARAEPSEHPFEIVPGSFQFRCRRACRRARTRIG